jgi:hypothetical protein
MKPDRLADAIVSRAAVVCVRLRIRNLDPRARILVRRPPLVSQLVAADGLLEFTNGDAAVVRLLAPPPTIAQPEIEQAVGKIISIAGFGKLRRDSAPWWESGGADPERENGQSASASQPAVIRQEKVSGRRDFNPRRPPWQVERTP